MLDPTRKRYPCPRAKEKPQQDSRRGKIVFRIKLITCQKVSEDSNKTLCTPGPRDATGTEPDLPCRRGRIFLYLVLMCSHHLVDYVAPDSAVQSSQQHLAASFFPGQSQEILRSSTSELKAFPGTPDGKFPASSRVRSSRVRVSSQLL